MKDDELSIFSKSKWNLKFKKAYESYLALKTVNGIEHKEALRDGNYSPKLVDRTNKLNDAYLIFSGQIIVIFCTYIEVMIKDFMYTVFQDNPDSVHKNYFSKHNSSEYDKFNSNENRSYKDICAFSISAAQAIFNFKIDKVINKICDISENGEERRCKDRLLNLKRNLKVVFQIRNFIVHENSIKYIKDNKQQPVVMLEPLIEFIYTKLAPFFVNELNTFCENLNIEKHQEINKNEQEAMDQLFEEILQGY